MNIFTGSFNINGVLLDAETAKAWLEPAADCQVAALGFQECRHIPVQAFPAPNVSGEHTESVDCYLRGGNPSEDAEFVQLLSAALPHLVLVSDVAMGEPPTGGKVTTEGPNTEWYGTLRLLLFVKEGFFDSAPIIQSWVIPAGNKASSFASAMGHYAPGRSPDKGGVALYLQQAKLLLVNCHLYGTNEHGVGEIKFDAIRLRQLQDIEQALLPVSVDTDLCTVVFGDLNYRVEIHSAGPDKVKGGKDWEAVVNICRGGTLESLQDLYKHDRLSQLLQSELCPRILKGCEDGLRRSLEDEGVAVMPTFTYKPGAAHPREYAIKRTPSWTDRVLVRSPAQGVVCWLLPFESVREIAISDHEPVRAVLTRQ
ncbi:unnamed protein product [Chrysoparadoxa australica]